MAARCEAAGRQNNEDNFQLTDNLSGDEWGFMTGREVSLGEKGALLAVCDGMGGMTSGAVASATAIKTIKEWFAAGRLTVEVMATQATILQHIEQAIIAADEAIKDDGRKNSAHEGMGSTIVLAWIVDNHVYVGWCGDSRAYRYNAATGLERLTRDHSYVQELVDSGKLSKDLAFEHPDNNIITRSLGDNRQKVKPDLNCFRLYDGDMILLCSDGLSGVLRDVEIESILASRSGTMEESRNALWTASEQAGWNDNVTIALCKIESGAGNPEKTASGTPFGEQISNTAEHKRKPFAIIIALLALIALLAVLAFAFLKYKSWL